MDSDEARPEPGHTCTPGLIGSAYGCPVCMPDTAPDWSTDPAPSIEIPTEGRCPQAWGPGDALVCGLRLPCPVHPDAPAAVGDRPATDAGPDQAARLDNMRVPQPLCDDLGIDPHRLAQLLDKHDLALVPRSRRSERLDMVARASSAELVEELYARITAFPPTLGTING